jgi:hypothetical protein
MMSPAMIEDEEVVIENNGYTFSRRRKKSYLKAF